MSVVPAPPAPASAARVARPWAIAVAAASVSAVALYFSRASLDVFRAPSGVARVAMLPSQAELVGLLTLCTVLVATVGPWLARRRRGARAGERRPKLWLDAATADLLMPLFALGLLVLPFLPWIADAAPIVRVFAGPLRFLIWFVVLAQMLFAARAGAAAARALAPIPTKTATLFVFAAGLIAFGAGASRLAGSAIYPGGDEPHYLIVMQSLLRDRDLKIENNHEREDYGEYFASTLEPHFRTRGVDQQIYSIHPVGLSFLAVPAYAIAGYKGVVALLVAIAALAAALMWRWTAALTGSREAATFAWAAVGLGAPYFFNAFAVYPEIPAALAVMLAASENGSRKRLAGDDSVTHPLYRGLAIAALPWLSTKYAPMAMALAAVLVWRARRRTIAAVMLLTPVVLSTIAWLAFFQWIWGSPLPSAPYGPDPQTNPLTLRAGAPGLLIDQEYGVFVFAPALTMSVAGWIAMWRAGGIPRRIALELLLPFGALLGTVGAFELWWGGSGIAGRPLVSGLPLMGPAIGWAYESARRSTFRRCAQHLALVAGIAITGTLLVAQGGLLLAEGRDGASELLRWLAPGWPATAVAPSFIADHAPLALAHAVPWIVALLLLAWIVRAVPIDAPGRASVAATLLLAGTVVGLGTALASVRGDRVRPEPPEARGRVDLVDDYDAVARPYAIAYSPLRRVDAAAVPSLFTMIATPGSRVHPQPVAVLLNARFSLSAGEYELTLVPRSGETLAGEIGLQLGRLGRTVTEWPVEAKPGEPWRRTFLLDVDTSFVGFVAPPELEERIAELRLVPRTIVDKGSRLRVPTVLAASAYGDTIVYFHDDSVYAEDAGFWIAGRATLDATFALARPDRPLHLRMHGGTKPSTVFIETPVWRREVPLTPDESTDVEVPAPVRGRLIPLRITTYNAFVPAKESAGSEDERVLGAWVEVVK